MEGFHFAYVLQAIGVFVTAVVFLNSVVGYFSHVFGAVGFPDMRGWIFLPIIYGGCFLDPVLTI